MQNQPKSNTNSDLAIARLIAKGDRQAFAELLDNHGPRIQSLVRRYSSNQSDTEDLIQEIFLSAFKSIRNYRGQSSLSTWLHGVALNNCKKYVERKPPSTEPIDLILIESEADSKSNPETIAAKNDLAENVHCALKNLTPEQRDVVVLHELHELTYTECALVLNVPLGTVKSRLFYAFRALKSSLSAYVLGTEPLLSKPSANQASAVVENL